MKVNPAHVQVFSQRQQVPSRFAGTKRLALLLLSEEPEGLVEAVQLDHLVVAVPAAL
jgi:hypothetical protein